jgi:hypothetical protein
MKKASQGAWCGSVLSFTLYTLTFSCAFCGSARAQEFSQVAHYSVRMFSYGLLTIETRTGDIRIEGWDEPRLEIEAEKVVRAKSEAAAKPLYDRLQIELVGQDKNVVLRTQYPPRRLWRPFRGESKLSVNYRVRMPYDANLKLKCVDGDVSISGLVGTQQVRVSYGDVEIRVPNVDFLRSLRARSLLGYVQSNLRGEDSAGFAQHLSYWNPQGGQDIRISVRMGGIYVYRED